MRLLDETPARRLFLLPQLAQDIRDALVRHTGPMGQLLECVVALENGSFERCTKVTATRRDDRSSTAGARAAALVGVIAMPR